MPSFSLISPVFYWAIARAGYTPACSSYIAKLDPNGGRHSEVKCELIGKLLCIIVEDFPRLCSLMGAECVYVGSCSTCSNCSTIQLPSSLVTTARERKIGGERGEKEKIWHFPRHKKERGSQRGSWSAFRLIESSSWYIDGFSLLFPLTQDIGLPEEMGDNIDGDDTPTIVLYLFFFLLPSNMPPNTFWKDILDPFRKKCCLYKKITVHPIRPPNLRK